MSSMRAERRRAQQATATAIREGIRQGLRGRQLAAHVRAATHSRSVPAKTWIQAVTSQLGRLDDAG
jgi:hypothetical protein